MGACGCRERDGKTQVEEESRDQNSPIQSSAVSGSPINPPHPPFKPSSLHPFSPALLSTAFKARELEVPFNSLYRRDLPYLSRSPGCDKYSATFLLTGKLCIVKQLTRRGTVKLKNKHKAVCKTAEQWSTVSHPNLIPVIDVMYDLNYYYIVSENSPETSLSRLTTRMTEKEAAAVIFQVLSVLHTAQRLHLGINPASIFALNPENSTFLLQNPSNVDEEIPEKYSIFTAPESEKTEKSDVWSCGAVLYHLLSLDYPYDQVTYEDLLQHSVKPRLYLSGQWREASVEVRNLLKGMLRVEGERRMTVEECLGHRFVLGNKGHMKTKLMNDATKRLRAGEKMTPLKAAITHFLITKLVPLSDLCLHIKVFNSLDHDGNGVLTESDLLSGLDRLMPHEKAVIEARKIMSAVQLDAGNTMNYNEYLCSAINVKSLFSMENLSKVFTYLDKSESGCVSVEEMKVCLFGERKLRERMWEELTSMRELKDGSVTFNEFVEMIKGQDRS